MIAVQVYPLNSLHEDMASGWTSDGNSYGASEDQQDVVMPDERWEDEELATSDSTRPALTSENSQVPRTAFTPRRSLSSTSEDEKIVVRFLVEKFKHLVRSGDSQGSIEEAQKTARSKSDTSQDIYSTDGSLLHEYSSMQTTSSKPTEPSSRLLLRQTDHVPAEELRDFAQTGPLKCEEDLISDKEVAGSDALLTALRMNYEKARGQHHHMEEQEQGPTNHAHHDFGVGVTPTPKKAHLGSSQVGKEERKPSPTIISPSASSRREEEQAGRPPTTTNEILMLNAMASPALPGASLSRSLYTIVASPPPATQSSSNNQEAPTRFDHQAAEKNSLFSRNLALEILASMQQSERRAAAVAALFARADLVEAMTQSALLAMRSAVNNPRMLSSLLVEPRAAGQEWNPSAILWQQRPRSSLDADAGDASKLLALENRNHLSTLNLWASAPSPAIPAGFPVDSESRKRQRFDDLSKFLEDDTNISSPLFGRTSTEVMPAPPSLAGSTVFSESAQREHDHLRRVPPKKRCRSISFEAHSSPSTIQQPLQYETTSGRVESLTLLYSPSDDFCLSRFQCLARQQIEVFKATKYDVQAGARGRNTPIVLGQVGIRCRHCASAPREERTRGSTYFPTRFERVYQTGINMTGIHLCQQCPYVPQSIREDLIRLRSEKSVAGGGKQYWGETIKKLGIVETEDQGLRMINSISTTPKPSLVAQR